MTFYPISPVACPRMTKRDRWKKRPVVVAYFAFRDEVRLAKVNLPIPYKVTFHVEMPPSWTKKKRIAMDGTPHLDTPDKDNFEKAFLDALFGNDSHVWSGWAEKRWASVPGIEVIPLPLERAIVRRIPPDLFAEAV